MLLSRLNTHLNRRKIVELGQRTIFMMHDHDQLSSNSFLCSFILKLDANPFNCLNCVVTLKE